jgi:hypothetical protein
MVTTELKDRTGLSACESRTFGVSRAFASIGAALLLVACSADLSGTVFVTMKSGDVKRAADIEIVLVATTPEFEAEWTKAIREFKAAYADADAALQEANRKRDESMRRRMDDGRIIICCVVGGSGRSNRSGRSPRRDRADLS